MNNQEIAVVKAAPLGQTCDQAPGIVGSCEGPGVKVACSDEWLLITKLQLNGRFLNAVDVLTTGEQLTDVR